MAIDQFLLTSRLEEVELTAYCFMPDHLHALVTGTSEKSDLKKFAATAKQRAGWRYKRRTGQWLWQEGYYEHVLRDDEDPVDVVSYIVNNPQRSKLVERAEDYPYWGSSRYSRGEILEFIGGPPLKGAAYG